MVQLASQDLQNAIKFLEEDLLKKTNRTAQENQLLAEIQAEDYSSTGALGQFLQGVTRGGMDEITALGDKNDVIKIVDNTNPDKLDVGVTAQDVKNALEKAGLNPKEGTIVHEIDTKNPMRLDYTKLIAPMLKAIQQLSNEVNKLKNEGKE